MEKSASDFIEYTKKRSAVLGKYLEDICNAEFAFAASHPLAQTMINRQPLGKLELLAEEHDWITLDYKVEFVKTIFSFWRESLKGYKDFYKTTGFLFYLFEDSHAIPNVTVVANTPEGNPYPFLKLMPDIRQVLEINAGRSWKKEETKKLDAAEEIKVLKVIEQNFGSIGKPSANQLNMKAGELRKLIINGGLGNAVNEIRKQNKKQPADFRNELEKEDVERIGWEGVVPPNY